MALRGIDAYKADVEANYLKTLELAPEFADRVRGATREERFAGGSVPNFFRKPYGPGWALVGDAGYNKDPITAQGIRDAFRDAELCSAALDETFNGGRSFDDAMSAYHRRETPPCCRSTSSPPSWPRSSRRRRRCSSCSAPSTATRTRWTPSSSITAGTVSPVEFFDPEHIGRIMERRPYATRLKGRWRPLNGRRQLAVCGLSTYRRSKRCSSPWCVSTRWIPGELRAMRSVRGIGAAPAPVVLVAVLGPSLALRTPRSFPARECTPSSS